MCTVAVVGCSGPSEVDGFAPLHVQLPTKCLSCDISGSGFGACAAMLGAAAPAFGGVIFFSFFSPPVCAESDPATVRASRPMVTFGKAFMIHPPRPILTPRRSARLRDRERTRHTRRAEGQNK